ncbi:MAG: adenosylcobalamin-dependent ribonucleoside-diphosphate reductase [Phycisphaerae bacterium]|jgi:ribonucleoside-diphosphate reductase alpha chain
MADIIYSIIPPAGEEPKLNENAITILQTRYLLKDKSGKCIETPAQMFSRVALTVASTEKRYGSTHEQIKKWHHIFYDLMASLTFLPNSPALMNAGRQTPMLSACFVLPVEDSVEDIFETIKNTALIQKAGGGTGFSLDKLRPTGDVIASSGGTTSGPISFWKVFSEATNAIQQGAFRRGANMAMCSVTHPDILKFLYAKQNLEAFTNFNISVKVTDDWMKKLSRSPKMPHVVTNPRTGKRYLIPRKVSIETYSINDLMPADSKTSAGKSKVFTVEDIWKAIIKCARATGEPGLAFIDRINQDNPVPSLGRIEATNPCGEQPLLPYEACTLGSINLSKFVLGPETKRDIDYDALGATIDLAVRFLDDILDAANYPVRDTVRLTQANRKIGLGLMGFADTLFMMGLPYDSDSAVSFGEEIMKFLNDRAHKASERLADERGPFPNWNQSIWRTQRNTKMRNAAVTTIAPTGTISIIAGCSSGIEPLYSLAFTRQVLAGKKLMEVNPVFKKLAQAEGFYSKKLEERIARTGTIRNIHQIPAPIRKIFKSAYDIAPQWHVKMQAAFQKHCDSAVSKTINLPENATAATVDKAYKLAYDLGCKGITVYCRKSRKLEPMSLN